MKNRRHHSMYLLLPIIIFSAISCSKDSNQIASVTLKPVHVVDQDLDDSVYFKTFGNIVFNNKTNRLFLTDRLNNRFLVFGETLTFIETFGVPGQGPGEFNKPTGISFLGDDMYVISDSYNARTQIVNKNYQPLRVSNKINAPMLGSCVQVNSRNELYVNTGKGDKLITVYDSTLQYVRSFGGILSDENRYVQTQINITKFTIDREDNIYCAFLDRPLIRKYASNDSLIFEINTSNYSEIINRNNQVEITRKKTPHAQYISPSYVLDISCDSNKFYVVFAGEKLKNPVYVYDKNSGKALAKIWLKYNNKSFNPYSIACSSEDYLYAINFGATVLAVFNKQELKNR